VDRGARDAAELLALVAGQDVEAGGDGVFRIARKVARDRVISTVDVDARHGHKSRNRRFDGYKAHLSIDPDSELIDEVVATPANTPDRDATETLLAPVADAEVKPVVLGDSAYADGATRQMLDEAGFELRSKCPPIHNATGGYPKDRFAIDLAAGTVTCPAGHVATITPTRGGGGKAAFKPYCAHCPLASACTTARSGRTVTIGTHEAILQTARAAQAQPETKALLRRRCKVERKMCATRRLVVSPAEPGGTRREVPGSDG
jgi:hypothetical protein